MIDIVTLLQKRGLLPYAFCGTCQHIQKQDSKRSSFYCTKLKSKRTKNGLLKVQCKNPSCGLYESKNIK